jgi:hypothetical protein
MAKWQSGVLILAAALAGGCGSVSGAGRAAGDPPHRFATRTAVDNAGHFATLHFDRGRQVLSFRLHEPDGVILLYRINAPRGVKLRGSAQLPKTTVPLLIATTPVGPSSSCTDRGARIICTVGEEWCPMPEGTWHFRVEKLAGPAGNVTLWFHVGQPPAQSAT